jgi:hypothetical protein
LEIRDYLAASLLLDVSETTSTTVMRFCPERLEAFGDAVGQRHLKLEGGETPSSWRTSSRPAHQ